MEDPTGHHKRIADEFSTLLTTPADVWAIVGEADARFEPRVGGLREALLEDVLRLQVLDDNADWPYVIPVVVEISSDLVPADTSDTSPMFGVVIPQMRERLKSVTGWMMPAVRVREMLDLPVRGVRVLINETARLTATVEERLSTREGFGAKESPDLLERVFEIAERVLVTVVAEFVTPDAVGQLVDAARGAEAPQIDDDLIFTTTAVLQAIAAHRLRLPAIDQALQLAESMLATTTLPDIVEQYRLSIERQPELAVTPA